MENKPLKQSRQYGKSIHENNGKDVNFGDFRNIRPLSVEFGFDRGLPVDRYYIEKFLTRYSQDILGRVLEIGDDSYTRQFGGDQVKHREVLHVEAGNPAATIIGDLTHADHVPSNHFDCFICTQTIHLIYDVRQAVETIFRILKPGGVLLVTFPGISQISNDRWAEEWLWGFTAHFAERLFSEVFGAKNINVDTYGNLLTALSFLQGLAVAELQTEELDYRDENFEMLISVRAVKPGKSRKE